MLVAILAALCQISVTSGADADAKLSESVSELERAALNREWAAVAQLESAQVLQERAAKLLQAAFEDVAARRKAFTSSGDSDMSSAGAYGGAVANFDAAASNWGKVAKLCATAGDQEKERAALASAAAAAKQAVDACQLAAKACEMAADSYGKDKAGQLAKEARASQAAAGWWEKLATR